jgi:hypothetical protein
MYVHLLSILILTLTLAASAAQARIIGPTDDRTSASGNEQIEGAVGAIICLEENGSQKISSGVLIGTNDHVTTTLHSFAETILSSCIFRNFHGEESKFLFSAADIKNFARYRRGGPIGSDQIEVELHDAINATAFTRDLSPLNEGEEFYGVTAYEEDLNPPGVITNPFIRKSVASNIQVNNQGEQVGYISDADFSRGGSGGVNLFLRNGQLVAKGIFQGFSTPKGESIQNFENFDPHRNFILSTKLRTK